MKNTPAAYIIVAALVFFISCSTPPPILPTAMPTPTPVPNSTPTPISIPNADAAIALVKSQFAEVARIQKPASGSIGASQNVFAFERADGWDIAFWQGEGDCPAGCINNHYWYFSVKADGRIVKAGEYTRNFNSQTNSFDVSGAPMWGVPK